jgi:chromosomal replication initiation ATPase DnaA
LVFDEVGYLAYGQDAANVLFHVLNDRHLRKRPMIFTINKPPSEWGKVLHDEDLAAAILDRGRLIHVDGPSRQTRHLTLEKALSADADRARISGAHALQRSARISDVLSEFGEYVTCRPCNIDTAHPGRGNSQLAPYSILDAFLLGFTVAIDP